MRSSEWFAKLFGFKEKFSEVQNNFEFDPNNFTLTSKINNRTFECGQFSTPTLSELRNKAKEINKFSPSKISHFAVTDIYEAHKFPEFQKALFQVASQFNCLEFVNPNVTPENGITGYVRDRTQGPACCLACPSGTIYRNYFVATPAGKIGQSAGDQINNLSEIENFLNTEERFWIVRNGYTNSTAQRMKQFNKFLSLKAEHDPDYLDKLMENLKIGLQIGTEVIDVFGPQLSVHKVSQAFCSAISISYSLVPDEDWKPLATLVLDGTYEATLLAGAINHHQGDGSNIVILSFIGGGVFGNDLSWIASSIGKAFAKISEYGLDIRIAHFRTIDSDLANLIDSEITKYTNA